MKPNIVAPGATITSAKAGTTNEYFEKGGCSMATPHVTGLAATLMDHYPEFRGRPALLRAHMMATAISHDDVSGMTNEYGLGRVSGYLSHWDMTNSAGWQTFKFWGHVNSQGYQYNDITVPPGTKRLVIVLTWDEPAASSGASRAVTYDLDLWVDHEATCPYASGDCGDYQSVSFVDNVEYIVVDNPPPGLYRMKAHPFNAPTFNLPYGMVAHIIRGETKPTMMTNVTVTPEAPKVGTTFTVKLNVNTLRYLVSGVYVDVPGGTPDGLTLLEFSTTRHDGVAMKYRFNEPRYTLGNVVPMLGRSATWTFQADTPGPKTFGIQVWSENGGEVIADEDDRRRHAAGEPGRDRGGGHAVVADPHARLDVLHLRYGPELRRDGGPVVDDAVLPVARRGQERGRQAPERDPVDPGAGRRGGAFRNGERHHPHRHPAQYLLPARLRRRPRSAWSRTTKATTARWPRGPSR